MKKRIYNFFYNLDYIISGISFVSIVAITVLGVFSRRVLNAPVAWLEEMQLLLFVWCVFTGASAAFRTGNHVGIDIVVDYLPKKGKKIVYVIMYVITVIILGYFLTASTQLAQQAGDKLTPYLKLPYTFIDISAPIGFIMMMLHYTLVTYSKLLKKSPERGE